jgi:predicted amidohydrolase
MFWNVNQTWPRVEVRPPPAPYIPLIVESGRSAADRHRFRVALCPLLADAHPAFRITTDGQFFRALDPRSLQGRDALDGHLKRLLRSAVEEDVHLLVLPELMVDEEVREHLARLLRAARARPIGAGLHLPLGVVAGSYHIWPDGQDPATSAPANESRLVDLAGRSLLQHEKRGKFRVTRRQVKQLPHLFVQRPNRILPEVVEGIVHGPVLEILETGLGRVALAICADCIAPDHTCLEPLFRELRPDLLIIVSMTPETRLFEELLERFAGIKIGCLFVNARCLCRGEDGQLLAAAQLALYEPEGAPPTRVRLRCGAAELEVRYYRPVDGMKGWRPLSQVHGEIGVEWLGGSERRLGLVLDLGHHWRWSAAQGGGDQG